MKWTNHHTHSLFCDGDSPPRDYAEKAVQLGFTILGFSSHAPLPFPNTFTLRQDKVDEYRQTIRSLSYEYAGRLEICLGMEIDFISGVMEDFSSVRQYAGLDYVIGGVHLVKPANDERLWFIDGPKRETYDNGLKELFSNDIRAAVRTYFDQLNRMIETQAPDIVAHIDKIKMHNHGRFFSTGDAWYRDLLSESLRLSAQKGCIVEVNTRGIYKGRCHELFPDTDALREMQKMGVKITLSSDAHAPGDLDKAYPQAISTIREAGYNHLMVFNYGKWKEVGIS